MNRYPALLCISILAVSTAFADDLTRNVETELKNQGFYYGDVDGRGSPELSAAVRRYQIRNGLGVTGDLNKETLGALHIGGEAPASKASSQPRPQEATTPPAPKRSPPVNLRRADDNTADPQKRPPVEDAPPLSRPYGRGSLPPPAPIDEANAVAGPAGEHAKLFYGTPYATAPRSVQENTIRRAQQILADRGIYRDEVDGQPGPATEEGVLTYQRAQRLQLTGRLDLQTLAAMRLLPGSSTAGASPLLKPFNGPDGRPQRQTFRGVWVE